MEHSTQALAAPTSANASAIESALVTGDLSKLTIPQRLEYYKSVCDSLGLNPLTKPFDYITLNGKLTLYPNGDCAEQLRALHKVSITKLERQFAEDLYIVTAHAELPNGRRDESLAAVYIGTAKGADRANALMKTETKAKRRVTLSICGLSGFELPDEVVMRNKFDGEAEPQVTRRPTGEWIEELDESDPEREPVRVALQPSHGNGNGHGHAPTQNIAPTQSAPSAPTQVTAPTAEPPSQLATIREFVKRHEGTYARRAATPEQTENLRSQAAMALGKTDIANDEELRHHFIQAVFGRNGLRELEAHQLAGLRDALGNQAVRVWVNRCVGEYMTKPGAPAQSENESVTWDDLGSANANANANVNAPIATVDVGKLAPSPSIPSKQNGVAATTARSIYPINAGKRREIVEAVARTLTNRDLDAAGAEANQIFLARFKHSIYEGTLAEADALLVDLRKPA